MPPHRTIEQAIKSKTPDLHAKLQAAGELRGYVSELASQISSETVALTQAQRKREKWDDNPETLVGNLNQARVLNREIALGNALEFPPDETLPPSQD